MFCVFDCLLTICIYVSVNWTIFVFTNRSTPLLVPLTKWLNRGTMLSYLSVSVVLPFYPSPRFLILCPSNIQRSTQVQKAFIATVLFVPFIFTFIYVCLYTFNFCTCELCLITPFLSHLFIGQIFTEHLLYVAGDLDVNKIDKNSCIHGANILERGNVK